MDIHPYLHQWAHVEAACCQPLQDDTWQFTFANGKSVTCDVVSFHGTGTIEDLVKEQVQLRTGWSINLVFDRQTETFTAYVNTPYRHNVAGKTSLNPSISLLSAYLRAL